jgi:hypothetical protein
MRTVSLALRLAAAASLVAMAAFADPPPDVPQKTRVEGKIPTNLAGAWLLYAQAQLPGDKSRALQPELWTVSQTGDRDVAFHILDVDLPKSIDDAYRAANRQPKAWEPTPDDIALLKKQWSKLPAQTKKDIHRSDVAYGNVEVTISSPENYDAAFAGSIAPAIAEAFKGSLFAFQIVEHYRPLPNPPGENVAQVMERKGVYIVQSIKDSVLEGKQFTGYVAAGPGVPIPITFVGPFRFYRLAKGNIGAPPAAKPAPRKAKAKK